MSTTLYNMTTSSIIITYKEREEEEPLAVLIGDRPLKPEYTTVRTLRPPCVKSRPHLRVLVFAPRIT